MFDFLSYMDGLCKANRLAQGQSFIHSTCSGINYVEGMLEQYQTTANFLCTSDVCSESTFLSSGGWFKRRVYMVFVLMRYEYGNAADCTGKLNTCRELFRQLKSGRTMTQSSTRGQTARLQPYVSAWREKMIEIWKDRLDLLGVHDTGSLRRSINKGAFTVGDARANMAFQFLEYGIYVDLGVSNGYRHGNGGDLEFLGRAYRYEHHLGKARERKPWFNKSWYISVEILKNHLASILGDQFAGAFDTLTEKERG